jgi:hypothetical protein
VIIPDQSGKHDTGLAKLGKMNKFLDELSRRTAIDSMRYVDAPPKRHVAVMARPTPSIQLKDKDIQLPAPPHNSCEKTRDELKFLQNLTSNVTPEQTKLIKLADDNMITDIFMVDYDWPDKEQIVAQLEDLNKQINTITMKQKYKFNRPRPEQLAKEYGYNIKVFPSSTTKTPAYPSGHTTLAYVIAYISSDMNPSNRDKDLEKANQVALSRMLMGVHYPSDNEASISLAKQIYSSIKTEWFKDEV